MPGRALLDTNVVIAFFSSEESICEHVARTEVVLSSTVLGELYYGARKSSRPARNISKLDEFAASLLVLACDGVTAQHYGVIKDRLRLKGRPIPENDIWIAAVALQHALPVATRDEHFKEVDGLLVEEW